MVNTQSCKKKRASSLPESSQWTLNNPILSRTLYQSFFDKGFSKLVDKHNHLRKLRRVFKLSMICICPLHGYVSKDHPRAMQIAWEIVKNGLDAEKLRGVESVAELYSKFFPNGNAKEGGL